MMVDARSAIPQAKSGHPKASLEMRRDGERVISRTHVKDRNTCGWSLWVGGGVAGETLQKPVGVKTLIHVIVVYSAWVW